MKVFGKYNIGDIVVSIKDMNPCRSQGDMYLVHQKSDANHLYYKEGINSKNIGDWRLATSEEQEAFVNGIKNIKDIKPYIFKEGQYIVTLINSGVCGKVNYCSKQRTNNEYFRPEIDTLGSVFNTNNLFRASDLSRTKWREATEEEAEEYERRKKPYDVTELNKCKPGTALKKGEIYKHNTYKGSIFMFDKGTDASYFIGYSLTSFGKNGGNFHSAAEYILATKEEADWLRECIKADRFIPLEEINKKEYNYEVVHTSTLSQFNFIIQHYGFRGLKDCYTVYGENTCVTINKNSNGFYSSLEFFNNHHALIHKFDDWLPKEYQGVWLCSKPINQKDFINTNDSCLEFTSNEPYKEIQKKLKQHLNKETEHQEPIIVTRKITKRKSILTI